MKKGISAFDAVIQSLLRNKLKQIGYTFRSEEEFTDFVENKIYHISKENSEIHSIYLGNPSKEGSLLFTYKSNTST